MPIAHVTTAGTAVPLIATPARPGQDWVGSLVLQYKPTKSDNTTAATGKIYIGFDGLTGSAVDSTHYDAYLDPTITSASRDLGTSGIANMWQRKSGTYINADNDGEGVSWFDSKA